MDFGYESEKKEQEKWASLGYTNFACPNCGRFRVEKCANKKHWCEKCNWVVEDNEYFHPTWRI